MQVGKYQVRDGLSKFMHGRITAMLADAYLDGSNRAFYDASIEAAPYMITGGPGVPDPVQCKVAGVKCERVDPEWIAENVSAEDAIAVLDACMRASEVGAGESKN